MIAADLFILNAGAVKAGYLYSEYISPVVINDSLNPDGANPGSLTMPCELFVSNDGQYTFMVMRSGICKGKMTGFTEQFTKFLEN